MGGDDYVIDGDLAFSNKSDALKFYQEQYHKKKEWQGLTDEEVKTAWSQLWYDLNNGKFAADDTERHVIVEFYRAIEAKLKEKNS